MIPTGPGSSKKIPVEGIDWLKLLSDLRLKSKVALQQAGIAPPPMGMLVSIVGRVPVELLERIDRGETLRILDVRSNGEFAAGHVPGAVNIPFTQLPSRMGDVPGTAEDELILYCGHGPRAYIAATALRHGGRTRIVYLRGHWAGWQEAGLRVER